MLFPTVCAKIFGTEDGFRVYGVGFSFLGVASLVNIGLVKTIFEGPYLSLGFSGFLYLYASFSALALALLLLLFKEEKYVPDYK